MLTTESRIQIQPDVLFREIGGEAVLLNLQTGKYFGLDETGTRMWQLLAERGAIEPVVTALADEYEVTEEQVRKDLLALVEKLAANQLVQIEGD